MGIKNDEVLCLAGLGGTGDPAFIDTAPNLLSQIASSGGDGSIPGRADNADLSDGLSFSQSGNVINITTNGQCIVIPDGNNDFANLQNNPQQRVFQY